MSLVSSVVDSGIRAIRPAGPDAVTDLAALNPLNFGLMAVQDDANTQAAQAKKKQQDAINAQNALDQTNLLNADAQTAALRKSLLDQRGYASTVLAPRLGVSATLG